MSATSAPFGLRPAYHPSGLDRAQGLANIIESGYTQNLLKGQAVKLAAATGYVVRADATDALYGVFDGVEWTDTTGRRRVSNYWPALTAYQTGSLIAYIWTDPQVVYEIQAAGSIAQTALGAEFDLSSPYAGSTTTGLSQATLGAGTAVGNNQPGQMRVVNLAPYVDNAWGDAYTVVRVVNSASQFFGTVNAIA